MQTVAHLLLDGGEAGFHRRKNLRLPRRLRVGDRGQPPGQLFLSAPQPFDRAAKLVHLVDQRFGRAGGSCDGAQGKDQQDHDQQGKHAAGQCGQRQRIVEVKRDGADLHHVLPNRRSMSDSFSST